MSKPVVDIFQCPDCGLQDRDDRQRAVAEWAKTCFGEAESTHLPQCGLRLLEEAVELFQACGGNPALAHKLVDYVFSRPVGEVAQELGGVSVTALVLAQAAGLSLEDEEAGEVARVLAKPVEHFKARNAAKNAAGLRDGAVSTCNGPECPPGCPGTYGGCVP